MTSVSDRPSRAPTWDLKPHQEQIPDTRIVCSNMRIKILVALAVTATAIPSPSVIDTISSTINNGLEQAPEAEGIKADLSNAVRAAANDAPALLNENDALRRREADTDAYAGTKLSHAYLDEAKASWSQYQDKLTDFVTGFKLGRRDEVDAPNANQAATDAIEQAYKDGQYDNDDELTDLAFPDEDSEGDDDDDPDRDSPALTRRWNLEARKDNKSGYCYGLNLKKPLKPDCIKHHKHPSESCVDEFMQNPACARHPHYCDKHWSKMYDSLIKEIVELDKDFCDKRFPKRGRNKHDKRALDPDSLAAADAIRTKLTAGHLQGHAQIHGKAPGKAREKVHGKARGKGHGKAPGKAHGEVKKPKNICPETVTTRKPTTPDEKWCAQWPGHCREYYPKLAKGFIFAVHPGQPRKCAKMRAQKAAEGGDQKNKRDVEGDTPVESDGDTIVIAPGHEEFRGLLKRAVGEDGDAEGIEGADSDDDEVDDYDTDDLEAGQDPPDEDEG